MTYPRSYTTNETECVTRHEVVGRRGSITRTGRRRRPGGSGHGGFAEVDITVRVARGRGEHETTAGGRALGTTSGPVLTKLAAQLLTRCCPIRPDVITDLLDVALQIEFVLLEPADVEFLAGGASFELPRNVLLVVAHNPAKPR